ncbi:hypothetical protein F5884DRAFT_758858 [Xylogone sp. PMI_703]|nr:hypothetical protein F5884DRAFT_758858 [Xylogone sp. PMI_703]
MKSIKTYISLFLLSTANIASAAPAATIAAVNPTGPLEEFHSKFFNGIFISTDDDVFNETFDTGYSRDLVENGNGVDFEFDAFKTFVNQQRQAFSNRKLVSSTFAIVPDDSTGLTGNVGHIATVSAILDGAPVVATIVAVLNTALDSNGNQVNTAERFVLAVQPS